MFFLKRNSMRRYLLLFLTCASAALTMGSCMPRLLISETVETVELSMSESVGNQTSMSENCYDFVLKAGRRELSGLMVARKESVDTVRVIGTTYFGMTLFDMTLTKDSYTMNSAAGFLEGKPFASFLAMKLRKTINFD